MVNVELAISVLSGEAVPVTLSDGQAVRSEHDRTPESSADGTASLHRRRAWLQLWTLRYSAMQFGAKVN